MAIHEFSADYSVRSNETQNIPHGLPEIPAIRQLSHAEGGLKDFGDLPSAPYVEEFAIPGFRALDTAMKLYWSGIKIPTKDAYRYMRVKIAGGDKSLLVWNDELIDGRVRLPVAAISREDHEFNKEKYSPPYHAMTARWVSTRGDMAAKVFRPVPFLINYNMAVWAERKRHAEYILYQVLTRFNPLAEFRMFDGRLNGNVQLRFGGAIDASDKEAGYDQHANVRYEFTMTAEGWLPLPEQLVPTILGKVTVLREQLGTILNVSTGNKWFEPIQE